jgi:TolA-binding protein
VKQRQFKFWSILILFGFALLIFSSCAYYNTFYNAKKYYKEGIVLNQTNPSQAKTSFTKAIEKSALVISNYPRSKYIADALFIIGMSNFYTGEYTKAISKFENLLLVFPSYPRVNEVNLYMAASLIETGEYGQAVERLQILNTRAVSQEIQELAMFKMAELYLYRKEYTDASTVLKNFITKYPKSEKYYQALLMLGDAERSVKDFPAAITTYETCLQKTRQRIGNSATDTSQVYKRVNLHLAECFIEADRQTEGLMIIDEIIAVETLPNTKTKLGNRVFLDLGNLFLKMNDLARGRLYLKKVTSMPEQLEAYYRLANSYESEAKFDTAKAYYDSVVQKQATGEFGTLAQSRLELLKLVVSDIPLKRLPMPEETLKNKPEELKNPEDIKELEQLKQHEQEELEQSQENQLPDSLNINDLNLSDSLFVDTLFFENDTFFEPIKPDTLQKSEDTLKTHLKSDTLKTVIVDTISQVDSAAIQFHLAEIYNLNLKKYEQAIIEYEKVFDKYPQSVFAPKALFAQAWLYKNILGAATDTNAYKPRYRQALDKIIVNYPDTEYANQAQLMLAELSKQE